MAVYKRTTADTRARLRRRGRASSCSSAPRAGIYSARSCRPLSSFSVFLSVACAFWGFTPTLISALLLFLAGRTGPLFAVDAKFFLMYLTVQSSLAFILTAFIGPGLVSPDLANGALTLYLCRPVRAPNTCSAKCQLLSSSSPGSRGFPGLVLFIVQASLSGWGWFTQNFYMAVAVVLGSWIWIITLALLALALSAWVKWRIAAGALLLAILFMGAGFAQAINRSPANQARLSDRYLSTYLHYLARSAARHCRSAFLRAIEAWIALLAIAGLLPVSADEESAGPTRWCDERLKLFSTTFEVLWRRSWRQPREPLHPARHYQPCRTKRLRQDDADEPDDRTDPSFARQRLPYSAVALTIRKNSFACSATVHNSTPFPKGLPATNSSIRICCCLVMTPPPATNLTWKAIDRVDLREAAHRKSAGYSKGMRQRIRLAQAIAHNPRVLVLDEPMNGLDPLVRAETIALFRSFAKDGCHVILSSHVLHEVDIISDQVILMSGGYVVAEGNIQGVRGEIQEQPMQILIRCDAAERSCLPLL